MLCDLGAGNFGSSEHAISRLEIFYSLVILRLHGGDLATGDTVRQRTLHQVSVKF